MNVNKKDINFEDVIARYISGKHLTEAELIALRKRIKEDEDFAREFKSQIEMEYILSSKNNWLTDLKYAVLRGKNFSKQQQRNKQKRHLFYYFFSAAASLLIIIFAYILYISLYDRELVKIKVLYGKITLDDRLVSTDNAHKTYKLKKPYLVKTFSNSFCILNYNDGTEIHLSGESELLRRKSTNKTFYIERGLLKFICAPQKSEMLVSTVNTLVKILGTQFLLDVDKDKTRVNLEKGKIEVLNTISRKTLVLTENQAVINDNSGEQIKTDVKEYSGWRPENEAKMYIMKEGDDEIIIIDTDEKELKDAKIVKLFDLDKGVKTINFDFYYKAKGLDSGGGIIIFKNLNFENFYQEQFLPYASPISNDWKKHQTTIDIPENAVSCLCVFYLNGNGRFNIKNLQIKLQK